MLMLACVDNIYAAHEGPVTLKKDSRPSFCSGPHFHGGVKLNGARVNPYSLLDFPFKNGSTPAATVATPTPEATPNPQTVPVRE
jgi:hypothetical protein